MNYCHYYFVATIHTHNMSRLAYFKLKEVCKGLFFDERAKRLSNKYWTGCKVAQYENSDPYAVDGIVLFEIWDANSVSRLKTIEGKLREICSTEFQKVVTKIDCRHVIAK